MGDPGPLVYEQDIDGDDSTADPGELSDTRVEEILEVIRTGNAYRLDELLTRCKDSGWDATACRDSRGLSLYVTAIDGGFLDAINTLLSHDIPLGDALIRCIEENFEDAIRSVCRHLASHPEVCKVVLDATCDNDDFHPAITPLILAAQRNNFEVVKMLVNLGATIEVPKISVGVDVTLTQAVSTLHIYRAISQPAYLMATQFDVIGHAFKMSKRLRFLGKTWQDFGAEFDALADAVDKFAADLLGQSASTEEVLALFRYHKTDQYRDREGRQHPLAKVSEAIRYEQKNFIAHPHSQKVLVAHFFRNLLSWNARGAIYWAFLTLFVLVFFPAISLVYILLPVPRVVRFVRIPYVMMLMKLASDLAFIGLIVALGVTERASDPKLSEALRLSVLLWNIGTFWMHIKLIWRQGGRRFVHYSTNIQEAVIVSLYLTIFFLQWDWKIDLSPNIPLNRGARAVDDLTVNQSSAIRQHVTSVLGGLQHNLTSSIQDGVDSVLVRTLSDLACRYGAPAPTPVGPITTTLPEYYQVHLAADTYDPILVSEALYGVAMMISIMRLTNLLKVSSSLGPLRISLGSMGPDFLKFFAIFFIVWFAFAVGMTQNYFSAGNSESQVCLQQGGDEASCSNVVKYAAFPNSLVELFWTLFGFTELETLQLSSNHILAEFIGTFLYGCYLVIGVLILLNALIGMLSNTYNIVEEDSDSEWKFHRAIVWDLYLHPVGTLPPPFNLIPSLKSLWRFLRASLGMWIECARRVRTNKRHIHAKNELDDYSRVIKLISSRYTQQNLSAESQSAEAATHRDVKQLKNDLLSLRYFTKDRLRKFNKTLLNTGGQCTGVYQKLNDLVPTDIRADDLNTQSDELADQTHELREKIDSLNAEIERLQKLLAERQGGVQELEPDPESEPEPEPEPDQDPLVVPGTSKLIHRLATMVEHDIEWGNDYQIRRELAAASRRADERSVGARLPRLDPNLDQEK